jgi:hypothetical protein
MPDTADPVSNLRDLRDSIDNIDAAIIHLLAERCQVALRCGGHAPSYRKFRTIWAGCARCRMTRTTTRAPGCVSSLRQIT